MVIEEFKEIITVYRKNGTKRVKKCLAKRLAVWNITAGGVYSCHWALKGETSSCKNGRYD